MIARFSAELVLDNFIKRTNAAIKNLSAKSDKTVLEKGQILGMTDALAILNGEIAKERDRVKNY